MKHNNKNNIYLDWPEEICGSDIKHIKWYNPASNICLDFHGDPVKAQLVVFSDGNHHMALKDCLEFFKEQNSGLSEIFYATTPPGPIVNILKRGGLQMGNLIISIDPHVFISPPKVLNGFFTEGLITEHVPFVRNQGNVLLIKKGNPKKIVNVSDLARMDIRLFLSNPYTEETSFSAYYDTLTALSSGQEGDLDIMQKKTAQGQVVFGRCIHHREAPQAVADSSADVAIVFYHLALRYLRIFPDLFDAIPLGGSIKKPEPLPGNIIGVTNMGLVGEGGKWGRKLIHFLRSKQALAIYRYHGLIGMEE